MIADHKGRYIKGWRRALEIEMVVVKHILGDFFAKKEIRLSN